MTQPLNATVSRMVAIARAESPYRTRGMLGCDITTPSQARCVIAHTRGYSIVTIDGENHTRTWYLTKAEALTAWEKKGEPDGVDVDQPA